MEWGNKIQHPHSCGWTDSYNMYGPPSAAMCLVFVKKGDDYDLSFDLWHYDEEVYGEHRKNEVVQWEYLIQQNGNGDICEWRWEKNLYDQNLYLVNTISYWMVGMWCCNTPDKITYNKGGLEITLLGDMEKHNTIIFSDDYGYGHNSEFARSATYVKDKALKFDIDRNLFDKEKVFFTIDGEEQFQSIQGTKDELKKDGEYTYNNADILIKPTLKSHNIYEIDMQIFWLRYKDVYQVLLGDKVLSIATGWLDNRNIVSKFELNKSDASDGKFKITITSDEKIWHNEFWVEW